MVKDYEYHKQNDYPGERVAEKKRVNEREEAADKRADARVAEKGRADGLKADNRVAEKGRADGLKADNRVAKRSRMDDDILDSEIERSTARASRINRERDNADKTGIIIAACVLVIIIIGFGWSFMALQRQSEDLKKQSDKIDSLNQQLANSDTPALISIVGNAELSSANKQIQLYKDFLVLTADVRDEVSDLKQYNNSYAGWYQLCINYAERSNNVNHAMNRYAEKEIIYYKQISILAEKPECTAKINKLSVAMADSKEADERLYLQHKVECDRYMNNTIAGNSQASNVDWNIYNDAALKAKAFTAAEKDVIACFA